MFWKFWFYCPRCRKIKNRFQVAYGTDNIRVFWHRCRECGEKVDYLKDALEDAIYNSTGHN